jgi:hypothetical protein
MPNMTKEQNDLNTELVDLDLMLNRLEDEKRSYMTGVNDQIRDCKERRKAVMADIEAGQARLPL